MSGSDTRNQAGVYGTRARRFGNVPGARGQPFPGPIRTATSGSSAARLRFGREAWRPQRPLEIRRDELDMGVGQQNGQSGRLYGTKGVAARGMSRGAGQGRFLDRSAGQLLALRRRWLRFGRDTMATSTTCGNSTGPTGPGCRAAIPSIRQASTAKGRRRFREVPGGAARRRFLDRSDGNLWLFGGYGFDSAGNLGYLNDLWKFDGTNWTWVSGSKTGSDRRLRREERGRSGNVPGARYAVSWTDSNGNFWLFGGYGYDSAGTWLPQRPVEIRRDEVDLGVGQQNGRSGRSYGAQGVAAPGMSRGQNSAVSWTDRGQLLALRGEGYDSTGRV